MTFRAELGKAISSATYEIIKNFLESPSSGYADLIARKRKIIVK